MSREKYKNIIMLRMAFEIAKLSKDERTKHGCILTDANYHILSAGYNCYVRGFNDLELPKDSPQKYAWFIHAERNAIDNSLLPIRSVQGVKAFITGTPCIAKDRPGCAMELVHNGVLEWHLAKRQGTRLEDEETTKIFEEVVRKKNIQITWYDMEEIIVRT